MTRKEDFWDVVTPDLVASLDDWNRNIPQRGETMLTAQQQEDFAHKLTQHCQSAGIDDKIRKATAGPSIDWASLIATLLPILLQLISGLFPPKPVPVPPAPAPVPPAPATH